MDYPPASSNENRFTGGRWNSNILSWHRVAVKLFQLLSVVNWDVIPEGVKTLAGAISCAFECLGEVIIVRTGELNGLFGFFFFF